MVAPLSVYICLGLRDIAIRFPSSSQKRTRYQVIMVIFSYYVMIFIVHLSRQSIVKTVNSDFRIYTSLHQSTFRRESRGGSQGAHAHPFLRQILFKSPLNCPKKSWGPAPEPPAPPLFSHPGSAPVNIYLSYCSCYIAFYRASYIRFI